MTTPTTARERKADDICITLELHIALQSLAPLYEPADALQWMQTPQATLDGQKPMVLIHNGQAHLVHNAIRAALDCIYL